jgi:hypothetical protein
MATRSSPSSSEPSRRVQNHPVEFRTIPQEDMVGIDIWFQNEDEAIQFEQAFA